MYSKILLLSSKNTYASIGAKAQQRELNTLTKALQTKKFPKIYKKSLNNMSDEGRGLVEGASSVVMQRLGKNPSNDELSTVSETEQTIAVIAARSPVDEVVMDMIGLCNAFNKYLVKDQSDDFVKLLLASNDFNESRCQEVIHSPQVLRAWLDNIEDYKHAPQTIGRVLESLLSGAGKSALQLGSIIKYEDGGEIKELILCKFTEAQKLDLAKPLQDFMDKFSSPELLQGYTRGPGGVFENVNAAIMADINGLDEEDFIYPDVTPLTGPTSENRSPLTGSKFKLHGDNWLSGAAQAGITTQYGQSGTTNRSLAMMGMLMNTQGKKDFFQQNIDDIMPLVVHTVMIPYLKAAYHTPAEVFIAAKCYIDTAQGRHFEETPAHVCADEALNHMAISTKAGVDRDTITALSDALRTFSELCQRETKDQRYKKEFNKLRSKQKEVTENIPDNKKPEL